MIGSATPTTTSLPVWAYWEGPRPPIVDLCLDTVRRHFPTMQLLDPERVLGMGGEDILAATADCLLPHRADLVRFWVMSLTGGLWFDADCIVVRPPQLHQDIEDGGLAAAFCRHPESPKLASFHFAAQAGRVMEFATRTCAAILRNHRFFYDDPSAGVLRRISERFPRLVAIHLDRRYVPLPWREQLHMLSKTGRGTPEITAGLSPYTFHLGGYVTHTLARFSREQLLSGDWFISHWLRVALEISQ